MRLFVAVPVPDAVKTAAARAIEELKRAGGDARWADPAALHLTLRFLGETAERDVPGVEKAVAAAVQGVKVIDLVFDRLGCFSERGLPKVVWAGVGTGAAELGLLAARLPWPEEKPFKAHLTLGRLRSRRGASFLKKAIMATPPLGWTCRAEELVLYKSELSGAGPQHTALLRVSLNG